MKRPTEKLLDDLLEEAAPPEFRTALLNETLRQARRRKNIRRLNSVLGAAACAGILAFAFWKLRGPTAGPNPIRRPDLIIVQSRPLNPAQIVRTKPGTMEMVSSSASTFSLVETRVSERLYAEIDDQQLLALLAGKPVALVHRGPNQAELIFLNPGDEKGFPIQ
jgi:hypothetical protein